MPPAPRITAKVMLVMPAKKITSQCRFAKRILTSSRSRVFWAGGGWIRSRVPRKAARKSPTAMTLNSRTVQRAPAAGSPLPNFITSHRKLVLARMPPACAKAIR